MIDREHKLSVVRREASASAVAASTICLVRCLTAIWPLCAGLTNCISTTPCRKSDVARALERRRSETGRRHVATLMKKMGIKAIYRRPNTSKPAPAHTKAGSHPAQSGVGNGPDLHPHGAGFVYLCAVVDWFSRKVLSWRLSITMEAAFCIEAVEEALARHGRPEIFNTDRDRSSPPSTSPPC